MLGSDRINRITVTAIIGSDPSTIGGLANAEEQELWDSILEGMKKGMIYEIPYEAPELNATFHFADSEDEIGNEIEDSSPLEKMSLVSKAANERQFTLGPMYVPDTMDAHGEWTDAAELQKAVWDYVRKGDRRIRLQHDRDVVAGEWVEIMTFPYTMSVPMNKADGSKSELSFPKDTVFLGVVWEDWAWDLVKKGELRGYSIGGKAERLYVDLDTVEKEDPTAGGVHVDTIMNNQPSTTKPKRKK